MNSSSEGSVQGNYDQQSSSECIQKNYDKFENDKIEN
jgi:hypothetical protein